MRILICDDEQNIIDQIRLYLQEYFAFSGYEMPELVTFSDGNSLLADTGQKDIVFLDIEMPESNGILVGNELKMRNPHIIIFITTSYMQYLDDAMRFQVFRYLSKPLEKARFFQNMNDAIQLYSRLTSTVVIENGNGSLKMSESDIIYIEAQARTTLVHTVSGIYPAQKPLHSWVDTLHAGSFFQTHKSYIVNMKYVLKFDHEMIIFESDLGKAYLSRRKYNQFKKAYFMYLETSQ